MAAVAVLATACSDGDRARVDLIAELDGRQRLATHTGQLLGEGGDDPDAATPEGRAAALADEIAESIELARQLLPEEPDAYHEAIGARPVARLVVIGRTLGYTSAALDRVEDDGGDPADTVAFALRLGWDLGNRLEPGAGGLAWVLDDPDSASSADGDEVRSLLAEGADLDAAHRLLDLVDPLGAAAIVDEIAGELASLVPVSNVYDLLTAFQTSFDLAAGSDGT